MHTRWLDVVTIVFFILAILALMAICGLVIGLALDAWGLIELKGVE